MGLFGSKSGSGSRPDAARVARHSSGWVQMLKHLRTREGLRVLDIGPTSAGNINFITTLGHSIYMANLVEDAAKAEYQFPMTEGDDAGKTGYHVERYLEQNLDFSGRSFDVVLLWDTIDYLPAALLAPVVRRLHEVTEPGGQLLTFFHSKLEGDDAIFTRYHLTDTDQVEMQRSGGHPIRQNFTNRQIEGVFRDFAGYKSFLAKDSLREVIVTR